MTVELLLIADNHVPKRARDLPVATFMTATVDQGTLGDVNLVPLPDRRESARASG